MALNLKQSKLLKSKNLNLYFELILFFKGSIISTMFSNLPVNTNRYLIYFFAPDKHKSEYFCFSNSGHIFFFFFLLFVQNVHQRQAAQSQGWFKLSWVASLPPTQRFDERSIDNDVGLQKTFTAVQCTELLFCYPPFLNWTNL